jgi:hypothetical protein
MKYWLIPITLFAASLGHAAQPEADDINDPDLFNKDKTVVFSNLEFLYWIANEPGLDYALKMEHPAWSATNVFANGDFHRATYDWRPGFRINIGWYHAPHFWDIVAQYTFLRDHGRTDVHHPDEASLFLNGTWPHPDPSSATTVALDHAHSDVHFHYNVGDVLCSRRFHPNPHFRMRLIGGGTVAWLRQNWEIHYTDLNNDTSHIRNEWRFTGAGLRLGLALDWYLDFCDFYLTGQATTAVLGGRYHNVSKQTISTADTPIRNAHYVDSRLTWQGQFLAGPSWQKKFKHVRTELFLGYEFSAWTNLQEVFRSTSGTAEGPKETWVNNGVLGIQGLTFRWNLDY